MSTKYVLIVAAALFTGCAVAPYQPPKEGEPSASLAFRNESPAQVNFWLEMNAARCTDSANVDSLFRMLPKATAEIKVRAGQDFSISAQQFSAYGTSQQMCVVYGTFHPGLGNRYVALFGGDNLGCAVTIVREINEGSKPTLVPEPSFRLRKRVTPLTGKAYCE